LKDTKDETLLAQSLEDFEFSRSPESAEIVTGVLSPVLAKHSKSFNLINKDWRGKFLCGHQVGENSINVEPKPL